MAAFNFMSVKLTSIGHTPQEVKVEFELEWQEEDFTDLQFKET